MPYVLLTGDFHIFYPDPPINAWKNGPEPDGDTLRFRPDSPDLVHRLRRPGQPAANFNGRGMVALRFEGIDALETHFDGGHQNLGLALGSRDDLLVRAGFGQITFGDGRQAAKVRAVERHPARGWVLANGLDGHGRVIGFVFFGAAPMPDRSEVMLDAALMGQSVNAASLAEGMSYPAFYFTLPQPLNAALGDIARAAATAGRGLHAADASRKGAVFLADGPAALEEAVIWPKLFRRLWSFYRTGGEDLTFFRAWLQQDPVDRDDRFMSGNRYDLHFHNIVEAVDARHLRLLEDPADLVIIPDDFVMPDSSLTAMGVFA